jgi:hypothetical protein
MPAAREMAKSMRCRVAKRKRLRRDGRLGKEFHQFLRDLDDTGNPGENDFLFYQ